MKTQEIFIAHPETEEQTNALKAFMEALKIRFEVSREGYDPEFVAEVAESKEQYQKGDFTCVEKDELKDFLGL